MYKLKIVGITIVLTLVTFATLFEQTAMAAIMPSGGVSGQLQYGINAQRSASGLAGLSMNGALSAAAQAKANDMVAQDYWAHVSPSGLRGADFVAQAGYSYAATGENLAYGYSGADAIISAWMNSAGHRANVLRAEFTEVGFGIANSNNYLQTGPHTVVVAEFGQPYAAPAPPPPAAVAPPTTTTRSSSGGVQSAQAQTQTPAQTSAEAATSSPAASASPSTKATSKSVGKQNTVAKSSATNADEKPVNNVLFLTVLFAASGACIAYMTKGFWRTLRWRHLLTRLYPYGRA